MDNADKIIIGKVLKAQGIRGELKILPLTDDFSRFKKLKALYIDKRFFKLLQVRIDRNFVYIFINGIEDRLSAEAFAGCDVLIDRIHAIPTGKNEFFIADIIGCKLFVDNIQTGTIINVAQNGAADVFEVSLINGKSLLFPFLKSLNIVVDIFLKRIDIKGEALQQVAVYN